MTAIELLGYVACALTSASFLPQALMVIKTRKTESLSLTTYTMFTLGVALWLYYGIATQSYPIVIGNMITLAFASIILWITAENKIRARRLVLA